jgi:hypothetical protein
MSGRFPAVGSPLGHRDPFDWLYALAESGRLIAGTITWFKVPLRQSFREASLLLDIGYLSEKMIQGGCYHGRYFIGSGL